MTMRLEEPSICTPHENYPLGIAQAVFAGPTSTSNNIFECNNCHRKYAAANVYIPHTNTLACYPKNELANIYLQHLMPIPTIYPRDVKP
jgi:hypothetical protein